MISQELQNQLRCKYNPDNSLLRKHQLKMLEILSFVDDFCKQNNINYWLSSGTCLGAVRHHGFIPWDDDVDIEMMREDYDKFVKLFKETDQFALQTYKNDKFYYTPFAKVREKDSVIYDSLYKYKGVFIDVLCLEYSSRFCALMTQYAHRLLLGNPYNRLKKEKNKTVFKVRSSLFRINKKMFYTFVPVVRLLSKITGKNKLRHTYGTDWVNNIRMESEIFPLIRVTFENKDYPVPGNYHAYLTRIYGDYMSIPPESELPQLHVQYFE